MSRLILSFAFLWMACSVSQGQNIIQKLNNDNQTNHFAQALEEANLDKQLNQAGPFTIFVPSKEAFDKLSIRQKSNSDLILNHIFTGMASERSLAVMEEITCLSGKTITVTKDNQQLTVNSLRFLRTNIKADNGIIHIIDGVIE